MNGDCKTWTWIIGVLVGICCMCIGYLIARIDRHENLGHPGLIAEIRGCRNDIDKLDGKIDSLMRAERLPIGGSRP